MATRKRALFLFFVALTSGAFTTFSAVYIPLSRGRFHGRRVLLEVGEKISLTRRHTFMIEPRQTHSKRILEEQIQVEPTDSIDDYGPPGSNPPYHQDPPTPVTTKSLHESTIASFSTRNLPTDYPPLSTDNFRTDYAPVGPDPTNPNDPPLSTDNLSTDYAPDGPDPTSLGDPPVPTDNFTIDYADYAAIGPNPTDPNDPPLSTDNFSADYAPAGPDPTSLGDPPVPTDFTTDYAAIGLSPTPDYNDYQTPATMP